MKIGSPVWFYGTYTGRYCSPDFAAVFPKNVELLYGRITAIDYDKDFIHVYVHGETHIYSFSSQCYPEQLFFTLPDAIDAMMKRLEEFKNDR